MWEFMGVRTCAWPKTKDFLLARDCSKLRMEEARHWGSCLVAACTSPSSGHKSASALSWGSSRGANKDHLARGPTCRGAPLTPFQSHLLIIFTHLPEAIFPSLGPAPASFVKGCPQAVGTYLVHRQPGTLHGSWRDWGNCFVGDHPMKSEQICLASFQRRQEESVFYMHSGEPCSFNITLTVTRTYPRKGLEVYTQNQLWSPESRVWLGSEWKELVHFILCTSIWLDCKKTKTILFLNKSLNHTHTLYKNSEKKEKENK